MCWWKIIFLDHAWSKGLLKGKKLNVNFHCQVNSIIWQSYNSLLNNIFIVRENTNGRLCEIRTHGVVSCPPPWDPVLKKIPAGLPASCWVLHSIPVESRNALNCAAIIPNLVGKPKSRPSASASSLGLMMTGTLLFGGAFIFSRTSSGNVSGTWKLIKVPAK